MNSQDMPVRTRGTTLSDDELMLFDFMFDGSVPEQALRREAYPAHMNVGYTHSLTDDALRATLTNLVSLGIIRAVKGREDSFTLTEAGGNLWTIERRPAWSRFVAAAVTTRNDGAPRLEITSPSVQTAKLFFACATRTRLHRPVASPTVMRLRSSQLLPWKPFQAATRISVLIDGMGAEEVDWSSYERDRKWWRSVAELTSIKRRD